MSRRIEFASWRPKRRVGDFPGQDDVIVPRPDQKMRAWLWAGLSEKTGQDPQDVRDIAAALGLVDQPQWQGAGRTGARERRRVK